MNTLPANGPTDSEATTPTPMTAPLQALQEAWQRVQAKGGSAGADHKRLARFASHWQERLAELQAELAGHSHAPQSLWLVQLPRSQHGLRTQAIPAARDQMLQTAVAQRIGPHLDRHFALESHGCRPGRSVVLSGITRAGLPQWCFGVGG